MPSGTSFPSKQVKIRTWLFSQLESFSFSSSSFSLKSDHFRTLFCAVDHAAAVIISFGAPFCLDSSSYGGRLTMPPVTGSCEPVPVR